MHVHACGGQPAGPFLFGLVIAAQVDDVRDAQPEQLSHVRGSECLEIVRPQQPTRDDFVAVGGRDPTDVAQVGQAVEVNPHPFHPSQGNRHPPDWPDGDEKGWFLPSLDLVDVERQAGQARSGDSGLRIGR